MTNLHATHCALCGRPLEEASSVEIGIGPICRRDYGYDDHPEVENVDALLPEVLKIDDAEVREVVSDALINNNARVASNTLVKYIAVHQKEDESMTPIRILRSMGYENLTDRIMKRLKNAVDITVSVENGRLVLDTPYSPAFVTEIKKVEGRKFDPKTKNWSVPVSGKRGAWEALLAGFEGRRAMGPKGPFQIEG